MTDDTARESRYGRWATVAAVAFSAVVAVAIGWRLRFGVDFVDEAFYVAIPFRFAHGARPFVDEMAIQQTAQLLLVPFIRAFLLVRGDATGIILFVRALWFVMMSGCAFVSYRLLRRMAPQAVAIVSSLTLLAFIPFLIPSLSYNTLGAAFLALGLYFGTSGFGFAGGARPVAAAGVCFVIAAFVYPPFVVAGPVFVVTLLSVRRRLGEQFPRLLKVFAAAYVLALSAAVLLLFSFGLGNIANALRFTSGSAVGGSFSKVVSLFLQLAHLLVGAWPAVLLLVAAVLVGARWRWASLLALGIPPVVLAATPPELGQTHLWANLWVILYVVLAWLVFLWGSKQAGELEIPVWLILLPATTCGAVAAYTSTNGYFNAIVGLLSAVPVSVMLLARIPAAFSRGRRATVWAATAFCALVVGLGLASGYLAAYGDARPVTLRSPMTTGPYKGMMTSSENVRTWTSLEQQLAKHGLVDSNVVYFNAFPAGYLLTPSPRSINSCWSGTAASARDRLGSDTSGLAYFSREGVSPDAGVRIDDTRWFDRQYPPDDAFSHYFSSPPYQQVYAGSGFRIWSRP